MENRKPPADCPMVEGDRRKDDQWRKTVEKRMNDFQAALEAHSEKHEKLVTSVKINNEQTQKMFDIFSTVEQAFIFIGKVYDGALWAASGIAKMMKPLLIIGAFVMAVVVWAKTGEWKWPI